MKKVLVRLSCLAAMAGIVFACLTSCKKSNIDSISLEPKQYENVLKFDNRNEYEAVLFGRDIEGKNFRKTNADFVSMYDYYHGASYKLQGNLLPVEIPVESDNLAKLLTPEGVIQIGKWLIKINVLANKVSVLDTNYKSNEFEKLLKDVSSEHIYLFSTNDDVLDLLEEGYKKSLDNKGAKTEIFCGGGTGGQNVSAEAYFGNGDRVTAYNRYSKYGVYFDFNTAIEFRKFIALSVSEVAIRDRYFYYKTNCRKYKEDQNTTTGQQVILNEFSIDKNSPPPPAPAIGTYKYKEGIYQSTRGLHDLILESTYRITSLGQTIQITPPRIEGH